MGKAETFVTKRVKTKKRTINLQKFFFIGDTPFYNLFSEITELTLLCMG